MVTYEKARVNMVTYEKARVKVLTELLKVDFLKFRSQTPLDLKLLTRFLVSGTMRFQTLILLITKKMLLKIFRKRDISSMQIKLCNSVYENN